MESTGRKRLSWFDQGIAQLKMSLDQPLKLVLIDNASDRSAFS